MNTTRIEIISFVSSLIGCAILAPLIMYGFAGALFDRKPLVAATVAPGYSLALAALSLQRKPANKFGDNGAVTRGSDLAANSSEPNPSSPGNVTKVTARAPLALPPARIQSLANRVWQVEPLIGAAIRAFAHVKDLSGDKNSARKLMNLAVTRSQRDHLSRYWLLKDAVARESIDDALNHLDILYRVKDDVRSNIISTFALLADSEQGRQKIIAALKNNPPWRESFLSTYPRIAKNVNSPMQIFVALKAAGAEPGHEMIHSFSSNLFRRGLVDQAYYAWMQTLTPEQLKTMPSLQNGDFEAKTNSSPFSWKISKVAGAQVEIGRYSRLPEFRRSLQVLFFGERVRFNHVSQFTMLTPGKYRMSGSYRLYNLNNPRGLIWRFTCLGKKPKITGESKRMRGHSREWEKFEFEFEVPGDNCRAQKVHLLLAARNGPERIISGRVLFDQLNIERQLN